MKAGVVSETADGSDLRPGRVNVDVILQFRADEARQLTMQHTTFKLWYGGVVRDGELRGESES